MTAVSELMGRLRPDRFRSQWEFTTEMAVANAAIAKAMTREDIAETLREWIGKYQPCFFGRAAAKAKAIKFCILTDEDLNKSDDSIRDQIAADHGAWLRAATRGKSSAFVIAFMSERLLRATPDDAMLNLAQRLANLYLGVLVKPDTIRTDRVIFRYPDSDDVRIWPVGVNYFAAHADERWWRDHRIPGGIAFSMNSVGHLVHSNAQSAVLDALAAELAASGEPLPAGNINKADTALALAMRTIHNASAFRGEPATSLRALPASEAAHADPSCPFPLPKDLAGHDWRKYDGWYNTDVTLPRLYFQPDQNRPVGAGMEELDFTYIYHDHPSNPDHAIFRGVKF